MTAHDPRAPAAVVGTGRWIAAARALETARPDRLFNDPWAALLAGESGNAVLEASDYNPFLPVRTRYFDDLIIGSVRKDSQIVLLGAGLDTRAFRLPLPASCTVFEIDYAEAFTEKEAVLRTAPARCERRCVHTDLSGPWTQVLLNTGFDRCTPTVWVAEGLFFYLTAADAGSLVCAAAALSAGGSTFLADIFGTGLLALAGMGIGRHGSAGGRAQERRPAAAFLYRLTRGTLSGRRLEQRRRGPARTFRSKLRSTNAGPRPKGRPAAGQSPHLPGDSHPLRTQAGHSGSAFARGPVTGHGGEG